MSDRTAIATATSLRDFQRDFAAALLEGGDEPVRRRAITDQPGFAVYRNTVAVACVDALVANYPTVSAIVGEEWFSAAAMRFQRATPPRDGCLASYGETFAAFLAAFEPARELPYLADVARLDRFWTEAHLAADAPVLAPSELGGAGDAAMLAGCVLEPHPSARWTTMAEVPAFTIWRRHREGADLEADLRWHGESALVVRPLDVVTWHAIPQLAAIFLSSCASGLRFGHALTDAAESAATSPEATAAEWLPQLVAAGAFSRWIEPAR